MRQFVLALCVALVSLAAVQEAAADDKVAGNWKLTALDVNGKPFPADIPNLRLVLTKDGKMEAYENNKLSEKGWYKVKPGNILVGYTDEDKDGVLDDEEKADAEEMSYTRNGNTLTLSVDIEIGDGNKQTMKMTFSAVK